MDYSTERLLIMLRRWELRPEGNPTIGEKAAPEIITTAVLAVRLSLSERGTLTKARQARDHGYVTCTYGHGGRTWQLTDAGRKYVDSAKGLS